MFTFANPLPLYITYRQIMGEHDKYSPLYSELEITREFYTHGYPISHNQK